MGKKLIFKKIRGRIIPILSDNSVSRPLMGRLSKNDPAYDTYEEGVKNLLKSSVELTRKIRESFKVGDYSFIKQNKMLMEGLAEDRLKNKGSAEKIRKLIKQRKK